MSNKGVIYASYQRQLYVKLISPSPFEGWMAKGLEVPPPPPACVRLVPVGREVEGRRYALLRMERPIVARAVYRATPAVSSPLGNGTAVEVKVAAEEVARPQQPAAEVRRLYYVAVRELGYVEGGPGYYPAGSVVRVGVKMPEAPPGRLRQVGGAQRDGERGRWRGPYLRRRGSLCSVPRREVRLRCGRARVG